LVTNIGSDIIQNKFAPTSSNFAKCALVDLTYLLQRKLNLHHPTGDEEFATALSFLPKRADETPPLPSAPADVSFIAEGDGNLLTDYFNFIMLQLVVCRLTAMDRVTRGAKHQDIAVGYGGLQCIHCASALSSRKFFWSDVDMLAKASPAYPIMC